MCVAGQDATAAKVHQALHVEPVTVVKKGMSVGWLRSPAATAAALDQSSVGSWWDMEKTPVRKRPL